MFMPRQYKPGNILTFTYNGNNPHDKYPKILILNPDFQGEIHGLNLHYLTETEINANLKPLLTGIETMNPQQFYFSKIRNFLRGRDVYRRYDMKKIQNPVLISEKLF